ncbi:MAG: type II toxin-antitoxin system VapC family toxin [Rubrobacter sp.]|nr:type II toxin-antitoxin system VapC family toxin [Rubrobacter sp.]
MDTGVFVALFAGDEEATPWAQRVLEEMVVRSVLAVSPAVYAELVAGERSPEMVEAFFSEKGIEVDWEIGREVWRTAGSRYGSYARDRKRRDDARPRRILADFLVGAHALHLGGRTLLTTDTRIFANRFPELRIVAPEEL